MAAHILVKKGLPRHNDFRVLDSQSNQKRCNQGHDYNNDFRDGIFSR